MLKDIVLYPNPLLKQRCTKVPTIEEYWNLWCDLWDTIRHHKALGLSCPQIGLPYRAFVFCGQFCADPALISMGGSTTVENEGCLSLPGIEILVERSDYIKVEYTGRLGDRISKKLTGFQARVWQHEHDHLEGILITDRRQNNVPQSR